MKHGIDKSEYTGALYNACFMPRVEGKADLYLLTTVTKRKKGCLNEVCDP